MRSVCQGRWPQGFLVRPAEFHSRARSVLGFESRVALAKGVAGLVAWVRQQEAEDCVEAAARELEEKGFA